MKYAIVNNERVEAQKGMKGFCPVCNKPVIARCGEFKVNHWAHTKSAHCDKWWEAETEWHRAWKDLFPKEWQEVIAYDEKTGEKHVADIKTDKGLVIEFQHSHIKPEEQTAREEFYKNMIWVVDGTRLKRDFSRFSKAFRSPDIKYIGQNIRLLYSPDEHLPKNWQRRSFPIIFDYQNYIISDETPDYIRNIQNQLWCLLPIKAERFVVIIPTSMENFINDIKEGRFFDSHLIADYIQKYLEQTQLNQLQRLKDQIKKIPKGRRWYL